MRLCGSCGTENADGQKFCGNCGVALATPCPQCGSPNAPGMNFCGDCGAQLTVGVSVAPAEPPLAAREAVAGERRLVSVLFADLVGFTPLSASRDAEEVRDLLSRYFEEARTVIERYGGTVEKFIGDAVMAVWGAPVAKEDDAERSVRAALDLVTAVTALGQDVGAPDLRARAGVLTGEAAVMPASPGEGLVAGDLVNTASRIQSAAEPGTVLVGESTKRASEAAVAYEDVGTHELKGKAEPMPLWRALRVVAGAQGAMRSSALEAPFVGRDRELRLIKELFHGSADEQKAQLVSVTGIAGIGKSRLSWEFEKYIDGLATESYWHRGRCLSYGEGVAYWALAEMVRMRCGIVEDEEPGAALAKLRSTIERHVPDVDERRWIEPRLGHLLGIEEGTAGDQENLFSAWRILFERLAEESPTILVFEDMQWADESLLDFLEYLLEWSRNRSIYVLVLARPELVDMRSSWGAGKRNFASLYLEPLAPEAMGDLLAGLVPGLPDDLRARILERAEGVPLYAVETVRMLLDRGLVAQEGNVYRPKGSVETLEVPETLHALIAARLDSLSQAQRRLVQDGAVLGKTFTKPGLAALTGRQDEELEPLLVSLVRKEILSIQADPRSPERGQYSFLQDIVKHIAYETISKKERKAKHLAAARFLSSAWSAEEDEIVEVVAAHYLDAHRAGPDDPDADEIRSAAFGMLLRAAERAASLGATAEAQRAYERALELTDDLLVRADLHERAGLMARIGARADESAAHLEKSIAIFEGEGETHPAARVSARLAEITWDRGRLEQALENMNRAFEVLSGEEADEDVAALAAQLGRFSYFAGDPDRAMLRIETALDLAEALALPETLSHALNTKAVILTSRGRTNESMVLLRHALHVALEYDKPTAALRAYYNLADTLDQLDRYDEAAVAVRDGLALARKVGNRYWEWALVGAIYPSFALGNWAEANDMIVAVPEEDWPEARQAVAAIVGTGIILYAEQGRFADAERIVDALLEFASSADIQERASYACGIARLRLAQGNFAEALRAAKAALEIGHEMGMTSEFMKEAFVTAVDAALSLGNAEEAGELLALAETLPPGRRAHFLRAHVSRFRARLAATGEDGRADDLFKGAVGLFRELAVPFYMAATQVEYAEWLVGQARADAAEPFLAEAREIFERLEARPWFDRVALTAGEQLPAESSAR
jgi:class 3 adenylate cyclase/tetratricopeptide (TPR) repeat protein